MRITCLNSLFLFFLFCGTYNISNAQNKEAAWWYFGVGGIIDFNSGKPNSPFLGTQSFNYSSSSISDRNGNLLFYGDNQGIYNRLGQLMPYFTKNPVTNDKAFDCISFPVPGKNGQYYFIYNDIEVIPFCCRLRNGIKCFVINLNEDGGNGDVIEKKAVSRFGSGITLLDHGNGKDKWIVTIALDSSFSYLVSDKGITDTVTSFIPQYKTDNGSTNMLLKSSTSSNLIYIASQDQQYSFPPRDSAAKTTLWDFDKTTGKLSYKYTITKDALFLGDAAFSPDQTKLYSIVQYHRDSSQILIQRDISLTDTLRIQNESTDLFVSQQYRGLSGLQLGLDGKIYIGAINSNTISTISCPNLLYPMCGFDTSTLIIKGSIGYLFPTQNQTLFVNVNKFQATSEDSVVCLGDSTILSAYGASVDQFKWLPATGLSNDTLASPVAKPLVTTTYTCYGAGKCTSAVASVTVKVIPKVNAKVSPKDTGVCTGSSINLYATKGYQYRWNGRIDSSTIQVLVNKDTNIAVQISNAACSVKDTVRIKAIPPPNLSLSGSKVLCDSQQTQLSAQTSAISLKWKLIGNSTATIVNDSLKTILINLLPYGITRLWVQANKQGCVVSDSVQITNWARPKKSLLNRTDTLCKGQNKTLLINPIPGETYRWSTGSTQAFIEVNTTGVYVIEKSSGVCPTVKDTANIYAYDGPEPIEIQGLKELCKDETTVFQAKSRFQYPSHQWQLPSELAGTSTNQNIQVFLKEWLKQPQTIRVSAYHPICKSEQKAELEIKNRENCFPIIPTNVIDPKTEQWEIKGIETYPHARIKIYNEWGNLVYESVGYTEPWKGYNKGGRKDLGVYYYHIEWQEELNQATKKLSGSISVF